AVVGVGVQPNIEIAEGSGLEVQNGILVDAGLETNVPGVFAAGDVALHDHPVFGRIRVEHYDNALKMGQHAAWSMLGDKKPFDDPHWFWSDQYDTEIQMAGFALSWDENQCGSSNGFLDRKSTRLNSSHRTISYAVFCLKKKK